jgi:HAD superfamily hydrolase (TIGR01549 family)
MNSPLSIRAILFDLDDTLLSNDMDNFLPHYLKLLSTYAAERYDPALLVQHLLAATEVMLNNTDPAVTNENAFWGRFSQLTGFDRDEMIPFFTHFYLTRFDELQTVTEHRPEARPLVDWAIRQDYQVVIATNPMFPRVAVDRRLAWAGIDDLNYTLVTSYENMHSTKPHPAYYQEILAKVDCAPAEALMIGDDWERDMLPAAELGLRTFWIAPADRNQPDPAIPITSQGTLADLWALCQDGWMNDC